MFMSKIHLGVASYTTIGKWDRYHGAKHKVISEGTPVGTGILPALAIVNSHIIKIIAEHTHQGSLCKTQLWYCALWCAYTEGSITKKGNRKEE